MKDYTTELEEKDAVVYRDTLCSVLSIGEDTVILGCGKVITILIDSVITDKVDAYSFEMWDKALFENL